MPTKITPRGDHIVFHVRGVECRADVEDAATISSGSYQMWTRGIVDAQSKRLLVRSLTGWRYVRFINGDKTDLRRRNLESLSSVGDWLFSQDVKIRFSIRRGKWVVRRQVRGVRICKICATEAQARHFARLFGRIGSAELVTFKKVGVWDEQFEWLQQDLSDALVERCADRHELARRAFMAGTKARDYIGARNAEALWK